MLRLCRAESLAERRPAALSGGERQRVALARGLAPEPRLLLLDEPLAGMDTELKRAILGDLVPLLAAWRSALVYVTHELPEVFQLRAEVFVMREGRIVRQGSAEETLAEERAQLLQELQD